MPCITPPHDEVHGQAGFSSAASTCELQKLIRQCMAVHYLHLSHVRWQDEHLMALSEK